MCNLMGREPSSELVDKVTMKYLSIGGESPLASIASAIARKLHESLATEERDVPVAVGMCYWQPFITDSVRQLVDAGCDRIVTVSLSPFESRVAHGTYRARIADALEGIEGVEVVEAPLVSGFEEYADWFSGSTATSLMDIEPNEGAIIVFSAHSLPLSDLVENDPYVTGLQNVAQAVAEKLGLGVGHDGAGATILGDVRAFGSDEAPRAWYLAYQSKGARGGEWLGPDVDEIIDAAAVSGVSAVLVVPIGFLTDHLETMYDLDIVAAGRALDAGIEFARADVPNEDDRIVSVIAGAVAGLL